MPDLVLSPDTLKEYLPHRGVNLLPDEVVLSADRTIATSRTRVPVKDARGREVMGRTGPNGVQCWYEPFLAELMALTGVPLLHERLAPAGQVAVFSMISRIAFHRPARLDAEVVGHAQITRDRSGFTVFSTWAEQDGQRILEAEVMSGASTLAQVSSAPIRPLTTAQGGHTIEPGQFAWKRPAICFVDRVVETNAASGRLLAAYSYPHDHPFVAGHFPGAALMMGVTQWAAVADAAWLARNTFNLGAKVVANGVVKRQDGSEVLDVRELVLTEEGGLPFIASTKRLAFREPVRPGDGLLIDVTVKSA